MSATYDESKHNRAGDGKFATKDDGRESVGQVDAFGASGDECYRCESNPCQCDNPLPNGMLNTDIRHTHEDEDGHPHFEVDFANANGERYTAPWMGAVGDGEPEPEQVLAHNAGDYHTMVEECGGDYHAFAREFGADPDDDALNVPVDEMSEEDVEVQSDEWKKWKSDEYDALQSTWDPYVRGLDMPEDDEEYERQLDKVYEREPARVSIAEGEFNADVAKLRKFKDFVGDDYKHYLNAFDNKYM